MAIIAPTGLEGLQEAFARLGAGLSTAMTTESRARMEAQKFLMENPEAQVNLARLVRRTASEYEKKGGVQIDPVVADIPQVSVGDDGVKQGKKRVTEQAPGVEMTPDRARALAASQIAKATGIPIGVVLSNESSNPVSFEERLENARNLKTDLPELVVQGEYEEARARVEEAGATRLQAEFNQGLLTSLIENGVPVLQAEAQVSALEEQILRSDINTQALTGFYERLNSFSPEERRAALTALASPEAWNAIMDLRRLSTEELLRKMQIAASREGNQVELLRLRLAIEDQLFNQSQTLIKDMREAGKIPEERDQLIARMNNLALTVRNYAQQGLIAPGTVPMMARVKPEWGFGADPVVAQMLQPVANDILRLYREGEGENKIDLMGLNREAFITVVSAEMVRTGQNLDEFLGLSGDSEEVSAQRRRFFAKLNEFADPITGEPMSVAEFREEVRVMGELMQATGIVGPEPDTPVRSRPSRSDRRAARIELYSAQVNYATAQKERDRVIRDLKIAMSMNRARSTPERAAKVNELTTRLRVLTAQSLKYEEELRELRAGRTGGTQ